LSVKYLQTQIEFDKMAPKRGENQPKTGKNGAEKSEKWIEKCKK
jgi:hypothetical protein